MIIFKLKGKSMKGIRRIPKDGTPLESMISAEWENATSPDTEDIGFWMMELLEHDSDNTRIATCMDWAMEIRETQGIEWAESIRLAMIFYYG